MRRLGAWAWAWAWAWARALAALAAAWALAAPSSASAQALVVRVTEAETARPIFGAFVSVLSEDGRLLRSVLTNAEGRANVRLAALGPVRVRAQMIGRETRESTVALPAEGEPVLHEVALPVLALPLTGIEVVGSARCALRREEGQMTSAVWEEAKKALEVAAWSLETELFRYRIELRTREYGRNERSVLSEQREVLSGTYREPFVSRPAAELAERGFVQRSGEERLAFAPGAAVLLSDLFLDTHCFRLRSSRDEALIGLGFEPIPRRPVPDIKGVVWMDRGTGELRSVEFTYTGLGEARAGGDSGGDVEFERLPSGAWIVRRWWIRLPILEEVESQLMGARVHETRKVGIQERAGEVVGIEDQEGTVVATRERAVVAGVAYDSVRGVPLAGARVLLVGTDHESRSDAEGRFRIADLAEGTYTVDASHPALDSLGLAVARREVTVREGGMSWVELAVSRVAAAEAADTGRARVGGAGRPSVAVTSSGRLAGRVVAAESGAPLAGVEVGLPATGAVTLSGEDGRFHFPLLAPGPYAVRARFLGREAVQDTVSVKPGESLEIELRLGEAPIAVQGILVEVERRDLGLEQAGFFDRRSHEHGIFMTREQIEERRPVSTLDLFQGLPEVRVIRVGVRRAVTLVGSRALSFTDAPPGMMAPCYPTVWIDDKPYFALGSEEPVFLDELVGPTEIAALEIYQSTARIPVQYNLQGTCGVIVIWTRR